MTVSAFVKPQWFHIPLTIVGLLVLFGAVMAALVVLSIIFHLLIGLLLRVPVWVTIGELSISQIAANRAEEPLSWVAGLLFCIVLIPYFDSYQRWLAERLREKDPDTGVEG